MVLRPFLLGSAFKNMIGYTGEELLYHQQHIQSHHFNFLQPHGPLNGKLAPPYALMLLTQAGRVDMKSRTSRRIAIPQSLSSFELSDDHPIKQSGVF